MGAGYLMICLHTSHAVCSGGEERTFEMYKTNIESPGFRVYHERLQPFLLFFVDAASYIDVDDEKWTYFLLWVLIITITQTLAGWNI